MAQMVQEVPQRRSSGCRERGGETYGGLVRDAAKDRQGVKATEWRTVSLSP